jgi:glutamine synthetase
MNTFNDRVMREMLSKDVYVKLIATVKTGAKLDMSIANAVAHAMKEWAISKGVTHFTHWFQPQTGLTAERHDSFLEVERDGNVIERFRGAQLVQGEPDASSFPSGGMRTTFEARGYTAWDPSSPAFIIEGPRGGILCIPSVFISFNGEALDKKTPLLRSMDALNQSALKVLKLFGNTYATRVIPTIGTEQEYFLIDKRFYLLRRDILFTGRTLFGAQPPKGQQLEDHYFGAIKERVLAFMQNAEAELVKLGVPAKTRHNEVAPHQFEIAPIYAEANIGADRNHLIMEVLKKTAYRHGLALLLHEKPFAGVNGSGKHNNWSMEDSEGNNLLDPGKTPEASLQFLVFLVSILKAVYTYGDLIRATVASAGNDHRLGANEAPPAIMSVFLGERLSQILDNIKKGQANKAVDDFVIDLGIDKLPSILRDNTDRNRTSPFAFTGAKFEFRAIGSSASVSFANTVLCAAVADSIDILVDAIQEKTRTGTSVHDATFEVLSRVVAETEPIRFEGNNYSKEWEAEAAKRGLPNVKRTGYALDALVAPKNREMLTRRGVLSEEELASRYHTKLEQYIKTLEIESDTLVEMISTQIIPAALVYQNQLLEGINRFQNAAALKTVTPKLQAETVRQIQTLVEDLSEGCGKLIREVDEGLAVAELPKQAKYFSDHVVDRMAEIRKSADELERIVADDCWPLPKYSEMLFIL